MFILETCNVTIVMFFYCRILFFLEDLFCGWNPIQCDFVKFDSVGHQFSSSWTTVFEPREKDLLIGKYGVFFLEWHRILGCITTWKIEQGTWFIYIFKLVNTGINCTPNSGSFIHSFIEAIVWFQSNNLVMQWLCTCKITETFQTFLGVNWVRWMSHRTKDLQATKSIR